MPARVVSATEFKAKCLALLDEMEQGGEPITITRRGHPVAVLSRTKAKRFKSPGGMFEGRIEIIDDMTPFEWDVMRED